ncbi:MFS transporter [Frankia sp. AiPs1]|uniref:MFS transporter n=1 Tax=Frankia sp. AiPa1 TaxID=573492 RepID=UPI00202B1F8E|nr:MFS transporter [Frankia sp. AiPa1]MCL9758625.1 MFS transporter [Frankia sp. AiPa1]
MGRRSLGREFRWLWAAYAVSAYGTGLGFGAFPLIAVVVLHAGAAEVSALSAVGPAVGALLAIPLGPWVESRRARSVMVAMDLARCAAMLTVPLAYLLGRLTIAQLLVVSILVAAAKIAFNAASGGYLKVLVRPGDLLVANARFESTSWSSLALGPPLGGAAIGLFGPVTTVVADAVSYLLSALGLTAIREQTGERDGRQTSQQDVDSARQRNGERRAHREGPPDVDGQSTGQGRGAAALQGWRHILGHPELRALFFNALLVNGMIMATEPLLAVLLLGEYGMPPWQYGLAFAVPCVGGLIGSRLARRVVARRGRLWVFRAVGTLRVVWLIGLALVRPGVAGLLTVIVVELLIIICMSMYAPVLATYRLEQTPRDRVARVLTAWSISTSTAIAGLTALGGLLAGATSPRTAITVAGLLILATPVLLPRGRERLVPSEAT